MKKQKREDFHVSIVCTKNMMSCGGGCILDNGSGYKASVNGKEICHSKDVKTLFEQIFAFAHRKTFYHDIFLDFPKEDNMSYVTLHTGQLEIVRNYALPENELNIIFSELFKTAKENDIPLESD
jgi:hypothetical protein